MTNLDDKVEICPINKFYVKENTPRSPLEEIFGISRTSFDESKGNKIKAKFDSWKASKLDLFERLLEDYKQFDIIKSERLRGLMGGLSDLTITDTTDPIELNSALVYMNSFNSRFRTRNSSLEDYTYPSCVRIGDALILLNNASRNLDESKPHLKSLDTELLAGADYLGASITDNYPITSMILLFRAVASATGTDPYNKSRIISRIREEIDVLGTDLDIEYSARDTGDIYTYDGPNLDGLDDIVKRRVDLLQDGPIYIKPNQGARALGVTRVEYDTKTKTAKIKMMGSSIPELLYNQALYKFITERKIDGISVKQVEPEEDMQIGESWDISLDDVVVRLNYNSHFDEYEILPLVDGEPDYSKRLDYWPLEFLHKFNFIEEQLAQEEVPADLKLEGEGEAVVPVEYSVQVSEDDLFDLLKGLEGVYHNINIPSYAESAIKIAEVDGSTWETRVMNFSKDFANAKPGASYVKMGKGNFIANICQGGAGRETYEVVKMVYRGLRPEASDEELEDVTWAYILEMDNQSERIVEVVSEYFTIEKDKLCPQFPFDKVPLDSCSTDFMARVDTNIEGKPILRPVLIDFNLAYEISGMEEADKLLYLNRSRMKYQKEESVKDFVRKVWFDK